MCVIKVYAVVLLLSIILGFCNSEEYDEHITNHLVKYGFLENTNNSIRNSDQIKSALLLFQEYYNLPIDGKLNNETLQLINTPRCGVTDYPLNFDAHHILWKKHNLSWHYALVRQDALRIAEKAFDVWSQNSALTFYHDRTNPDILITNKQSRHKFQRRKENCPLDFDDEGGSLAHAYFPDTQNSIVEIHVDSREKWDYSTNATGDDKQVSLYSVLIHEIGHALGLRHSSDKNAIMYPYYKLKLNLGQDDINGIQHLYGAPILPATTTVPTVPTTPTTGTRNHVKDLCEIEDLSKLILVIINQRLYVIRENLVWIVDLNNVVQKYDRPYYLTDWLSFIPKDYRKIDGAYQRPNGEVVLIIDNTIYKFDINSLQLSTAPMPISLMNIPQTSIINAVVNTYTGKTYILYDDMYYSEINECSFTNKAVGAVSDIFPGVPLKVEGAFRYIDGLIYFFKNGYYITYNQFSKRVLEMNKIKLKAFNIHCYNTLLIERFKEFISGYEINLRN